MTRPEDMLNSSATSICLGTISCIAGRPRQMHGPGKAFAVGLLGSRIIGHQCIPAIPLLSSNYSGGSSTLEVETTIRTCWQTVLQSHNLTGSTRASWIDLRPSDLSFVHSMVGTFLRLHLYISSSTPCWPWSTL